MMLLVLRISLFSVFLGSTALTAAYGQGGSWKLFPSKKNKSEVSADTIVPALDTLAQQVNSVDTAKPTVGLQPKSWADTANGRLEVVADYRLEELLERYDSIRVASGTMAGFRVQIASETGANSRAKANSMQADFLQRYPEVPSYVIWEHPNYKVRVGDFRSRLEALRLHEQLREDFPGAFVVQDAIQLPNLAD